MILSRKQTRLLVLTTVSILIVSCGENLTRPSRDNPCDGSNPETNGCCIQLTSPSGGESWEALSSRDITWESNGDIISVNIELSTNNGSSWLTTPVATCTANDGEFNWIVSENLSEACRIKVADIDGEPEGISKGVFAIVEDYQIPTVGLIAYWPFSGNTNDESGFENHGTNYGALLTEDRFGISESAYEFNGMHDDVINVPHSQVLNLVSDSPITITAWVYRRTSTWPMHVVGKRTYCSGYPGFYQLAIGLGAIPSDSVPLHTWSHLAVTAGDNAMLFYVNGVVVFESTEEIGANSSDLKIGTSGTCKNFTGTIDEVRIYDRTLSEAEIEKLVNEPNFG